MYLSSSYLTPSDKNNCTTVWPITNWNGLLEKPSRAINLRTTATSQNCWYLHEFVLYIIHRTQYQPPRVISFSPIKSRAPPLKSLPLIPFLLSSQHQRTTNLFLDFGCNKIGLFVQIYSLWEGRSSLGKNVSLKVEKLDFEFCLSQVEFDLNPVASNFNKVGPDFNHVGSNFNQVGSEFNHVGSVCNEVGFYLVKSDPTLGKSTLIKSDLMFIKSNSTWITSDTAWMKLGPTWNESMILLESSWRPL